MAKKVPQYIYYTSTSTATTNSMFRYPTASSKPKEYKLINQKRLDSPFQFLENEQLRDQTRDHIIELMQRYYRVKLKLDFDFLAPTALDTISELIQKNGFPFGKGARQDVETLIRQGRYGNKWDFTFSRDASNNRLAREVQQKFLAMDAFLLYSSIESKKSRLGKRKRCSCWILPYGNGWLFLEGDAVTARKMCRLISEWSGIPHRVNVKHEIEGATWELKNDAIHYLGVDADVVDFVTLNFA